METEQKNELELMCAEETLERLRKRLLDLTARNRLINFRHTGSLRIVDELPNQLAEMLLSDEEMSFSAVPEPTEEELIQAGYLQRDEETGEIHRLRNDPDAVEWARHLGIKTHYEVPGPGSGKPEGKHADRKIQTLLYPYELEARLKTLSQKAESAIQEMGANILYLAFGFLEWYESTEHDKPRLAPLFLIPVKLHRGRLNRETGTYEYRLTYSGEEIIANLSLREKLRVDFGMALPDLEEGTDPEAYFVQVQEMIGANRKSRWRVRRYLSLALLNFSKLLMYLDLDPARWPEDHNLLDHPVVSRFLRGYGREEEEAEDPPVGYGEEYSIDELEAVHDRYPLIEDADSSQHSALVDAIKGRNLVIEGPPGTGKSQTITNLIAAAMAQGKRVLFVAEKLAALEVVRSRLDRAGLGEFCLELHSHKSQKRRVLDEIQERLRTHGYYRRPSQIEADIARLESLRQKLAGHAKRINTSWKNTGLTVHEILMAAVRYREEAGVDPVEVHLKAVNGEHFDPATQLHYRDEIATYSEVCQAITRQLGEDSELKAHPWFGVGDASLQLFDREKIAMLLDAWQAALETLRARRIEIAQALESPVDQVAGTLEGLRNLHDELQSIPHIQGDELLDRLPVLQGKMLERVRRHQAFFIEMQNLYDDLARELGVEALMQMTDAEALVAARERLRQLVAEEVSLGQLAEAVNRLQAVREQLERFSEPLQGVARALGEAGPEHLVPTRAGLETFRTLVRLVSSLPPSAWRQRDPLFDDDELDELLPKLRAEAEGLRTQRETLRAWFLMDDLPDENEIRRLREVLSEGGLLSWLRPEWRQARRRLRALAAHPKASPRNLVAKLVELERYAGALRRFRHHPRYRQMLGEHFRGLETDLELLESLRRWYREIRGEFGVGFGVRVALGEAVMTLDEGTAKSIRSLTEQGLLSQLDQLFRELDRLKGVFAPVKPFASPDMLLVGEEGVLSRLVAQVEDAVHVCGPLAGDDVLSLAQLGERIKRVVFLHRMRDTWEKSDFDRRLFGGRLGLRAGPKVDNDAALAALEHTLYLAEVIEQRLHTRSLIERIHRRPDTDTFDELDRLGDRLGEALASEQAACTAFAQRVGLDRKAWSAQCGDDLETLIGRNRRALENLPMLDGWLQYVRQRDRLADLGLEKITEAVERGRVRLDRIESAYQAGVHDLLAREILAEEPELERFSGRAQESLQQQFREYDERLKQLQCERIAWQIDQVEIPRGNGGARVGEYSERVLLEHECTKRNRHLPIRQLLQRAGNALAALKPCFMMSPMSVAQYLAPGQLQFDLVIMDEASQIKPQDALGAIARGTQLVVVGDPKQLPPTSFFDRILEDGEEDSTALEESESILDATIPMFPVRRLRWHYRSRHESLIAFSNRFFYENDLVLFPSPFSDTSEYGIRYTRLRRGCFVNRRNLEEAREIAEAVRDHFRRNPQETLGVVAMSAEQRLQLERAIETLAKEDTAFQEQLDEDARRSEPLFVKNLENVQGDERDVIFISMTYGPREPGGNVPQRFGPINSDMGWRRLNVLFTRSRKRMHLFSSMDSEDIVVGPTSRRGVKALRDFLSYCETGLLYDDACPTGRDPDSDFEVAVMEALRREGFECVPQVGVAGFFIDIAVVDPSRPGRYLMGIECDGATYHSAKSTRDRDRLRQEILERLGWRIRRIWSTDWFRNPRGQLEPIVGELRRLAQETPRMEETEGVEEIVQQIKVQEEVIDPLVADEEGSLEERLRRFDREVIRPACPDTPENRRLLRPAMLEALLAFRPTSKVEFLEKIPAYLRQGTEAAEGRYLEKVFEIINISEEENME